MNYQWSLHAEQMMRTRRVRPEWVAATLADPARTEPDRDDPGVLHALRAIAENNGRVLRVLYNPMVDPPRIVSVYFDRRMRGQL